MPTTSRSSGRRPTASRPSCSPGGNSRTCSSWTSGCRGSTASRPPRLVAAEPACAGVRVLVLTTFDVDETVFAALAAGASGFLLKDATPEEIVHGVRVVAAGESILAPSVTSLLVREYARRPTPGRPRGDLLAALTERETEVLHLVAAGPLQRRDRRPARHQPRHGQDARQPRARQARRPGPRPAGRPRLRGRPRRARHLTGLHPGMYGSARGTRRRCSPGADDRRRPPT